MASSSTLLLRTRAQLEALEAHEMFEQWREQRFRVAQGDELPPGLKAFGEEYRELERRVFELERLASQPLKAGLGAELTRAEIVKLLTKDLPHNKQPDVFRSADGHVKTGFKRSAELLENAAADFLLAKKVCPDPADPSVAALGPEHAGLKDAITATAAALQDGTNTLHRLSRNVVLAAQWGWDLVDDLSLPALDGDMAEDEKKRLKELIEARRKEQREAKASKASKAKKPAGGGNRGSGRSGGSRSSCNHPTRWSQSANWYPGDAPGGPPGMGPHPGWHPSHGHHAGHVGHGPKGAKGWLGHP